MLTGIGMIRESTKDAILTVVLMLFAVGFLIFALYLWGM